MGVLSCGKNGCDNIMCDTYVYEVQMYICNKCLDSMIEDIGESPTATEIEEWMSKPRNADVTINLREYRGY